MSGQLAGEVAAIGVRLLDDAYMAWLAAENDSEQALRAWYERAPSDRVAYFSYCAAVDREEAAARDLERLGALVQPCRELLTAPAGAPMRHIGRA
jgi:hypothetical protein